MGAGEKMVQWFRFVQFKYRIFFSCLLVALVPLLTVSFFLVRIFDLSLKHQAMEEGARHNQEARRLFEGLLDDCVTAALSLDNSAATILIDSKNDAQIESLYMSLYNAASSLGTDAVFSIYDVGGKLRFTTGAQTAAPKLDRTCGLLKDLIGFGRQVYYYTPEGERAGEDESRFEAAYPIENSSGMRTGILVLDFSQKSLEKLFRGCYSADSTLVVGDPEGRPIFSSNRNLEYGEQERLLSLAFSREALDFQDGCGYLSSSVSGGYTLIQQVSAPIGAAAAGQMGRISLAMSLACLGLCLLIAMALSRRISEPIKRLRDGMRQVRRGDLSVQVPASSHDELGELTEAFNRMTRELKGRVDEAVEQEKALSAARLKLYQTQLNPHFLYNTLDTIKWSARIHGLDHISLMAENLAVILRRAVASPGFVTLGEELETIESYIAIQRERLPESFQYEAEVPVSLMSLLVPAMLLQPLVENAVVHGLDRDSGGYICVSAGQEGDRLRISVYDDGNGIPPAVLSWINSAGPEKPEGHLGLYNLISILKIHYGEGFGLKAACGRGQGTTITIILPMEAKHV